MMYNFLIVFGLLLIIVGLYGERSGGKKTTDNEEKIYAEITENIEPIIESLVKFQGESHEETKEKQSFEDVLKSVGKPSYNEETLKTIKQYEVGNYTLEEACKILDMKKGEVLLLRNICKKFQN